MCTKYMYLYLYTVFSALSVLGPVGSMCGGPYVWLGNTIKNIQRLDAVSASIMDGGGAAVVAIQKPSFHLPDRGMVVVVVVLMVNKIN